MPSSGKILLLYMLTITTQLVFQSDGFVNPRCDLHFISEAEKQEFNRKIVYEFYTTAFAQLNFPQAAKWLSPFEYIQHNPTVADRIGPFVAFGYRYISGNKGIPGMKIMDSAADGDFVWVHTNNTHSGVPVSVVDIYRLKCGVIVEHWDVAQTIGNGPFANDHPFF